ncbi:MAG: type I glyceraldehyde-3-phosphate dehydrogenase [Rhodospirillales bacterium CG15_BIG_FIL_POST_REV_8_21_14_020_66_15]|nr:MAG: type I glyceraldehyde-3-phosphate dehydrogenase [Rhodospirillales bacterium CG15_BIG_FIL_POST_REV_8_21_14_020_66_15]
MTVRIAINGFGRMGRLALRAAWGFDPAKPATLGEPAGAWGAGDIDIVHINEPNGSAEMAAHLMAFDSIHGRWPVAARADGPGAVVLGDRRIGYSGAAKPAEIDWAAMGVDLVLECSGKFKTRDAVTPYYDAGVKKVVVSAPVKGNALNIVMGVNDGLYDPKVHDLVTAASCTTNCLAPVVKVVHEGIGIYHGMITTIHDVTNTQTVIDKPMKDMRRARSALANLIPTSTGSATAITMIFPELKGKLDGIAVRVPLLNASITDCVFEVSRRTTVDEVNNLLRNAAAGPLKGILACEERPLVSSDFKGDTHSSIIDAPSTMVTDGTQVKIIAWYDNEMGYAHRLFELTETVARSIL